jgi:WhiB family redox-sensing transcriptional regulator
VSVATGAWRSEAACLTELPELFDDPEREAEAKRVCEACPVLTDCLSEALERREPTSIWGGMTPAERSTRRRRDGQLRRAVAASRVSGQRRG